jgi:hypothetical protein
MSELYKQQRTDIDKKIRIIDRWIVGATANPDPDAKGQKAILQALTSAQRYYNEQRIKLTK